MQSSYTTTRLFLKKLQLSDADFIKELVNTEGWIKFIGERDMNTEEAAAVYMHKLTTTSGINYWAVTLQQINTPVGVVTLIKRDYLQHYDIGFAFLPAFQKKGYAYEAANALLNEIKKDPLYATLLATTLKENTASIHLLQKLGFTFEKEFKRDAVSLLLYSLRQS